MPKLCISPQSRLNSCLYPNSAKIPSSATSTASEPLLALETLLSIGSWGSVVADMAGVLPSSAITSSQKCSAVPASTAIRSDECERET